MQSKHKWNSLVPGPKGPDKWNKIKKIIKEAMKRKDQLQNGDSR